ncbi:hypothetical protein J6590_043087, partial [Homalodisca vitripennis]
MRTIARYYPTSSGHVTNRDRLLANKAKSLETIDIVHYVYHNYCVREKCTMTP